MLVVRLLQKDFVQVDVSTGKVLNLENCIQKYVTIDEFYR